jgi:hypothetical protein
MILYILLLLGWKLKWVLSSWMKRGHLDSLNGRLSVVRLNTAGLGFRVWGVSQLGGANMPPRNVYYIFEGVGAWFLISSQIVPIEFLLFPSISHQNPFVLIKFSIFFHQIPLVPIKILFVPIKFQSNSFCSHQVPKKSHQIPLVPINKPSISFCSHQVMSRNQPALADYVVHSWLEIVKFGM